MLFDLKNIVDDSKKRDCCAGLPKYINPQVKNSNLIT